MMRLYKYFLHDQYNEHKLNFSLTFEVLNGYINFKIDLTFPNEGNWMEKVRS